MTTSALERCILFADVAGSTRIYEKLGDAEAKRAVERCLKRCRLAVEQFDGRVIKTIGDGLLAVFASTMAATQAACQMQLRVDELPKVAGFSLGIRVGFHTGPVLEENGDVFGDTVNLAARLADLARSGQIIASAVAVAGLSALARQATRALDAMPVKGKSAVVPICEVLWRDEGDLTQLATTESRSATVDALQLRHKGKTFGLSTAEEPLVLGRDKGSGVVVSDPLASRHHARIECRGGKFVLIDSSTNGTWLSVEGEPERSLRREESALLGRGRICFGHPWRADTETLEYDAG